MNDTVTAKAIAEALHMAVMTVTRHAKQEQWPFEKRSGCGGGKVYPVATLPAPIQIALRNISRPALGIIQGGKAATTAATPAVAPASPLATASPEPALPPAALSKAALKADLVKAYLEAKEWGRKHGKAMAEICQAFVLGYNAGNICPTIREKLGKNTSVKSLDRWVLQLRQSDFDCTAIAPRQGLHRQGACKVTEEEESRLLALLLSQSQFKIGTAINLVKIDLDRLGIASPSSPSTLRNFAEAFKREHADVWTLAREGEKALTDKIAPHLRRNWDLVSVGDVLIADGHRLNFRIKHPVHGRPCRASLIAFEDGRSRDICGYAVMLEEDLAAIHLALYRSILRLGKLPTAVYLDNGKAFKSKVFTATKPDLTASGIAGLYGRLNIKCHFANPYNSRAKPIESFWKTAGLSYEKAVSSYCGGSIDTKPARMKRNEKFMQDVEPEALITMEEAAGLFESWLNTYYRVKSHSGLHGQTPGEVFAAGRGAGLDHARIRYLMMHEEVAHLHNNGIKLFAGEYWDEALYGLRDKVFVRFDWHDLRQIFVYRTDGTYLCMAKRLGRTHPMFSLVGGKDAEGYADFKAALAEHARLKRGTKSLVRKLSKAGLIAEARDILPVAELASTGSPKLPETLERVEAANTPPEPPIPDFSEPTPAPSGPGPLIDPTNLEFLSTEELGAELAYQEARAKQGERQ